MPTLFRAVRRSKSSVVFDNPHHFQEAARNLKLSQPALSHRIKQLEKVFTESPLLHTKGKKKILSPYARELAELSEKHFSNLLSEIAEVNKRYSSPEKLVLKIGGRIEIFRYLSRNIQSLCRLALVNLSGPAAMNALTHDQVDIGIGYNLPNRSDLIARKIGHFGTYLVFPDSREFKDVSYRSMEIFQKTPFLTYRKTGPIAEQWQKYCGNELNSTLEVDDWDTIIERVKAGLGYSVIPTYSLLNKSGLRVLPLPHTIVKELDFYFVYKSTTLPILKRVKFKLVDRRAVTSVEKLECASIPTS